MKCYKYTITNTATTWVTFGYHSCESNLIVTQDELFPGQHKYVWAYEDTIVSAFQTGYNLNNDTLNPIPISTGSTTTTTTIPPTPTPTLTPNCVRQIVVPTLWNGATSINSNTLQLTQTSETLQIQVNDIITDNIGATSFVGIVSSDGTYTYVYTGPGGGLAFNCQFPLTFSGAC